mgnify:CR=1 FL=1
MSKEEAFRKHMEKGYTFKGDYLTLGAAMLDAPPADGPVHTKRGDQPHEGGSGAIQPVLVTV